MDGLKLTFLLFLCFMLVSTTAYSLTQEEKVYFDGQNQKVIAQVNAKIDTQTNRVEAGLKKDIEETRNIVIDELAKVISGSLKAVAVGLAGLIIVTLAVFKVIDLKLSATRNMKKYEDELKMKTFEVKKLIGDVQLERQQLANARQQLIDYQNKLNTWEMNLRKKEAQIQNVQAQPQQPQFPQVNLPPQNQPQPQQQPISPNPPFSGQQSIQQPQAQFSPQPPISNVATQKQNFLGNLNWKKIIIGVLVLLIFSALAGIFYKFVIAG